jgi:hypothetical protein
MGKLIKYAFFFFTFCPCVALAANNTVIGSLTLTPTFENISVSLAYTDDDNEDMTAVVEYQVDGAGSWTTAHDVYINRSGDAGDNTIRTSCLMVKRATTYNVRVTLTDADGVTGTNPTTGQTTTWSHDQPSYGGCSESVSNDSELSSALSTCNGTGGVITLSNGNYSGLTISADGASTSAYIHIVAQNKHGANFTSRVTVNNGQYIHFDKINFGAGLTISGTSQYNIVDECDFDGNEGNFYIGGTVTGLLVENNTTTGICAPTAAPDYNTCTDHGPDNWMQNTSDISKIVVRNNTVTDVRDLFGTGTGSGVADSDFYGNTIYDIADDGFEADDAFVNVRYYKNRQYGTARSFFSTADTSVGPVFVFLNIVTNNNASIDFMGFKVGKTPNGTGRLWVEHNTFWLSGSGSRVAQAAAGSPSATNQYFYNNILSGKTYIFQTGLCSSDADYNGYAEEHAPSNKFQFWNNGCSRTTTAFDSLSTMCSSYNMECNAVEDNASLVNPGGEDFNLDSGSAFIGKGVSISGIYEDYAGTSWSSPPSIGAYEDATTPSASGITSSGVTQ